MRLTIADTGYQIQDTRYKLKLKLKLNTNPDTIESSMKVCSVFVFCIPNQLAIKICYICLAKMSLADFNWFFQAATTQRERERERVGKFKLFLQT